MVSTVTPLYGVISALIGDYMIALPLVSVIDLSVKKLIIINNGVVQEIYSVHYRVTTNVGCPY